MSRLGGDRPITRQVVVGRPPDCQTERAPSSVLAFGAGDTPGLVVVPRGDIGVYVAERLAESSRCTPEATLANINLPLFELSTIRPSLTERRPRTDQDLVFPLSAEASTVDRSVPVTPKIDPIHPST